MRARLLRPLLAAGGLVAAFSAGALYDGRAAEPLRSAIVSQDAAKREDFEWGTLYTYYAGETYGTKDVLAAVAVIKPGKEIHPPHEHAEEEVLMVTEGNGSWTLEGRTMPAKAGDIQYAAPWDSHGVTNTGTTPLTFVVWKWNNKGVALPAQR